MVSSMGRLWANTLLPESKAMPKESNRDLVWRVKRANRSELFIEVGFEKQSASEAGEVSVAHSASCGFGISKIIRAPKGRHEMRCRIYVPAKAELITKPRHRPHSLRCGLLIYRRLRRLVAILNFPLRPRHPRIQPAAYRSPA